MSFEAGRDVVRDSATESFQWLLCSFLCDLCLILDGSPTRSSGPDFAGDYEVETSALRKHSCKHHSIRYIHVRDSKRFSRAAHDKKVNVMLNIRYQKKRKEEPLRSRLVELYPSQLRLCCG
jgi:hypothetical protein